MKALSKLSNQRPFIFVLLVLLGWIGLVTIISTIVSALFQVSVISSTNQRVSTLAATLIILLFVLRLGWLHQIGLMNLGTWGTWGITLLLAMYLVITGFYAFFNDISFNFSMVSSEETRTILVSQLIVGFVEETIFRGIILFALVRIWGATKRGVLAAVVVQGVLFALLHSLQIIGGGIPASVIINVVSTFVLSLWIGVLVLKVKTIWPAIVLHTIANASLYLKALESPWLEPYYLGYVRGLLFELPLMLLALWLLFKASPWQAQPPASIPEAFPSAK